MIDVGDFKFKFQYQLLVELQSQCFKTSLKQPQHHLSKVSFALANECGTSVNECGNSIGDCAVTLSNIPGNVSLSMSIDKVKI